MLDLDFRSTWTAVGHSRTLWSTSKALLSHLFSLICDHAFASLTDFVDSFEEN